MRVYLIANRRHKFFPAPFFVPLIAVTYTSCQAACNIPLLLSPFSYADMPTNHSTDPSAARHQET